MKSSVSKTDLNLWVAFADEAKTQRLYAAYATQAMNEGYPEAAEAFMEAAGAEIVHAMAHLTALKAVKSTVDNLRRVIEDEARESALTYPRYIAEARAEGREDAVRAFALALRREEHHAALFARTLQRIENIGVQDPSGPAQGRAPGVAAVQGKTARPAAPGRPQPRTGGRLPTKMAGPAEITQERQRIASRSRIRELVFGGQDGVLTTVSVVSSFFGAHTSRADILFAGLASGFAGMVAMTAGSYLSSKAQGDVERSEIEQERRELQEHPAEEMAELVEIYRRQGMPLEQARDAAIRVSGDQARMLKVMAREELGLDIEPHGNPLKDAGVMALSFLVGAIVPTAPYVFLNGPPALITSILLAALALFGVGVVKAKVADTNLVVSGMETFAIGAGAGLLGYVLGTWLPNEFGLHISAGA
ncbi:MAG: VIT1/CCC1 transporter family protein [Candidatus Eremiobacteraeota bacterium]|nr:VIT1/CCC1 transporter family protein [Candidatus Eremiobacteraeota bacterium]MBC5827621.1 VIT1/CCC1 transporter family protein [Candidatus Eremiobacteraeota bacterium]